MNIQQYFLYKKAEIANLTGNTDLLSGPATPTNYNNVSIDIDKGTINGLDNLRLDNQSNAPVESNNYNNYDSNIAGTSNDDGGNLSSAIDKAYGDFNVDDQGNFKYSPVDWGDTDPNQDVMSEMNSGVEYGPGYKGEINNDGYNTEVGELGNPVNDDTTENSLEDYGNQNIADNPQQNPGVDDGSFYGNPAQTGIPQNQPQRPSYQAMQQNKQELQEWDDHYNAIKQNIMNPGQIARWRANGFTDEQMNAYADREARKKATNRYGNRPNDIMEEYNYNMAGYNNQQQSPMEQFGAQPMSSQEMISAQNQPQANNQERLREGNPIYDKEVERLNNQIAKLQQRIQSGAGPFNKARNKDIARHELSMIQSQLDGIKALGLAPDGSFNGTRRMGKWSLQ